MKPLSAYSIRTTATLLIATFVTMVAYAAPVASADAGPKLKIRAVANTLIEPGEEFQYRIDVRNEGTTDTDGSTINFNATLPEGVTVSNPNPDFRNNGTLSRFASGGLSDCTRPDGSPLQVGDGSLKCSVSAAMPPYSAQGKLLIVWIGVKVDASAMAGTRLRAEFEASGGGAAPAHAIHEIAVSSGSPEFGISSFDGAASDADGQPYDQAGGTPYSISTDIRFETGGDTIGEVGGATPAEDPRNIAVDLPAGLVGSPAGLPECTNEQLSGAGTLVNVNQPICPPASQVGVAHVQWWGSIGGPQVAGPQAIYNLVPPPDVPARFGFNLFGTLIVFDAEVRSDGDYGLTVVSRNTPQAMILPGTSIEFWGVPADPSHDPVRACPGLEIVGGDAVHAADPECIDADGDGFADPDAPEGTSMYVRPGLESFLRIPTRCSEPGEGEITRLHVDTWQNSGDRKADGSLDLSDPAWKSASFESHDPDTFEPYTPGDPHGVRLCGVVPFAPDVAVNTTSTEADSPTGLDVDLSIPQTNDPNVLATSDLKDAVVTLPEGFTINPSSANGLKACTLEEIDLDGRNTKPDCPDASKVGTVEIDTPLLDEDLTGSVYVAEPDDPDEPGAENPFDSLVAIYIVAEGPGTVIKLPGKVDLDEETGQVQATFKDNPQLPFNNMHVEFFDGPESPIATPRTCGSDDVVAELSPWARPNDPVTRTDTLQVSSGPNGDPCPANPADRPFDPQMHAGTRDATAGAFSPFIFRLTREDGEQEILSTEVTPPEGVTGKLAGIPLCSDEDAEAGTCDEASKVGEVIAGAGAGPTPFYIQGDDAGSVYLSGPYKGAPLSLLIQVPAVAGPFDLGMVNVRAAMFVDKRTTQLRVVSDPIPQIMEGIPLRTRDIRIKMNREAFTIAPTNCREMQVEGVAHGANGATADLTNRFQVGDCGGLGFSPKLRLAYKGKRAKRRNAHPRLSANLRFPGAQSVASGAGATQANLNKVRVTLPKGTILDQDSISRVCTPTQWEAEDCPSDSRVGFAKAWSPLLDEPLKGPVYLKVSPNVLPDLAADLEGIVDIDLFGKIDQSRGRIRNTFQVVPDVAVERFRLNLKGGSQGLLANSVNVCKGKRKRRRANVVMKGQNGATVRGKQSVVRCGKKKRKRRR